MIKTIQEFICSHCGFITRRITDTIRSGGCPACGRGTDYENCKWEYHPKDNPDYVKPIAIFHFSQAAKYNSHGNNSTNN